MISIGTVVELPAGIECIVIRLSDPTGKINPATSSQVNKILFVSVPPVFEI